MVDVRVFGEAAEHGTRAACAPQQSAICVARFVTELFFVQLSLKSG